MVNVAKLKGALKAQNITIVQASKAMGIDPATFFRRINQRGERFTLSEVGKLAELLGLDWQSLQEIFFER